MDEFWNALFAATTSNNNLIYMTCAMIQHFKIPYLFNSLLDFMIVALLLRQFTKGSTGNAHFKNAMSS